MLRSDDHELFGDSLAGGLPELSFSGTGAFGGGPSLTSTRLATYPRGPCLRKSKHQNIPRIVRQYVTLGSLGTRDRSARLTPRMRSPGRSPLRLAGLSGATWPDHSPGDVRCRWDIRQSDTQIAGRGGEAGDCHEHCKDGKALVDRH